MTEAMLEADQASRVRRHEASRIDRALWLDEGRIVADGPFATVRAAYLAEA